jgi:protein MAK11
VFPRARDWRVSRTAGAMATLVAGSYERFVFGYSVQNLPGGGGGGGGPDGASVTRSFTLDAHLTQCKSVAAQGGFLASGGADDLIRVWHHNPDGAVADLGTLSGHEGTVSCLAFHGPSAAAEPTRMVSGGVDGSLIIWSVARWDALKTLRAHRGGVHALSVHRSGRVAMSAGADSHVAMWDMIKGRVAHKTKLRLKPELLAFTPSGNAYATVSQARLTITSAETGACVGVFDAPKRVMCLAQAGSDRMAYLGCEGGDVVAFDARAPPTKPALTITGAHPARVKALVAPSDDPDGGVLSGGPGGGPCALVSASSDGVVRLWDLRGAGRFGAAAARGLGVERARDEPVAEASGGGRFTCLATMPTALPSRVAEAVLAEGAAGRARDGEAARKKEARKQEKMKKIEKARAAAARPVRAGPGAAGLARDKREGERADGDADFEVVAGEERRRASATRLAGRRRRRRRRKRRRFPSRARSSGEAATSLWCRRGRSSRPGRRKRNEAGGRTKRPRRRRGARGAARRARSRRAGSVSRPGGRRGATSHRGARDERRGRVGVGE